MDSVRFFSKDQHRLVMGELPSGTEIFLYDLRGWQCLGSRCYTYHVWSFKRNKEYHHCTRQHMEWLGKGSFNNYVDQILLSTDPLPPSSCPRSYLMNPNLTMSLMWWAHQIKLQILFSPFFSPIFLSFEKVKKEIQFLTGPNNLLRIFFFSFEQKIIKKYWWNKLVKTGFVGSQFDLMCLSIFFILLYL